MKLNSSIANVFNFFISKKTRKVKVYPSVCKSSLYSVLLLHMKKKKKKYIFLYKEVQNFNNISNTYWAGVYKSIGGNV